MSNRRNSLDFVSQADLENELMRLKDEMLSSVLDELTTHSQQASEAEVKYKVQYAKALLSSQMKTVRDREADATVKTEQALFDRLVTERAVVTAREKLRAYQTSIDGVRTLLVGLRDNLRS